MNTFNLARSAPATDARRLPIAAESAILHGPLEATHAHTDESPVIRLFRQWDAARKASAAIDDEASAAAMTSEQIRLENELIRTPAACARDFAAKVIAYTAEGWNTLPGPMDAPALWAEIDRFVTGRV